MSFERALQRYADRIYRLALIREPHPRHAAQATVKAYTSLDWNILTTDDRLEERLVGALPPVKRQRIRSLLCHRTPGDLPQTFWNLPADVRLALALRWSRGYDASAIAGMRGCSADDMRVLLENALNDLAEGV